MVHAISARLARLARQTRSRLATPFEYAAWHGWETQRISRGTWEFRDPRFSQPVRAPLCPRCGGSGEHYYQAHDGEYVLAACDLCGNGRVGSKGAGTLAMTGGGQE